MESEVVDVEVKESDKGGGGGGVCVVCLST